MLRLLEAALSVSEYTDKVDSADLTYDSALLHSNPDSISNPTHHGLHLILLVPFIFVTQLQDIQVASD